MLVRPACDDDADGIAEVHVRGWQAGYAGLMPDDYLATLSIANRRERWCSRLASGGDGPVWVAEDSGGVVGFAACGPSRDADAPSGAGEVYAVYVHPDRWRSGAGRRLLEACTSHLRAAGFGPLTLWVLADNVRARRFYAAAGWRPDGAVRQDTFGGRVLDEVRLTAVES